MEGTIKFFTQERFFGFITLEGDQEFFFHGTSIVGDPVRAGDTVTFDIEEDRGRMRAVNVTKIYDTRR
jgi:cold shock CspA family protein